MNDASSSDRAREFYDDLAATYDQIYPDWEASVTRQAAALDTLIRSRLGHGPIRCLDCACGIGTQLIGLAMLGYDMAGTDLSSAATTRARHECSVRGLTADVRVADMRELPHGDCSFDAVVCADNSLPHLLTEADVRQALGEMRRVSRPGAVIVITTRDYDRVLPERPTTAPVQLSRQGELRTVSTQLWDWRAGSNVYDLTHLQVHEVRPGQWTAAARTTAYRAWSRAELTALATQAELRDVTWKTPEESGFFQPALVAVTPRGATAGTLAGR